jgi:hypothetical protein
MIGERLPAANESFGFIKAILTPLRFGCKAQSAANQNEEEDEEEFEVRLAAGILTRRRG